MDLAGDKYQVVNVYDQTITIPDCWVTSTNKIGTGHGEAKLYFGSKAEMRGLFGGEGFLARCALLKTDLLAYLDTVKDEYCHPRYEYKGGSKMPELWKERFDYVSSLRDELIEFEIKDHTTIQGPRGYIIPNNDEKSKKIYSLLRDIALPIISYMNVMELKDKGGTSLFYWKLFPDFEAMKNPLVFSYGKKSEEPVQEEPVVLRKAPPKTSSRDGQAKYREKLLEECPFCPITSISDERLLIASHIKPWAVSNDKEKIDPKNGFMLSPLYDRLFDQGFITFTDDRHVKISNWLGPQTKKRINLEDGKFIQMLPVAGREKYLDYHRNHVFKK